MRADVALVSCIMPTRNRRPLVGQALAYFLRQDYPRAELIVVDDGEDPISDLVPADPRVRYIRLATRTALGTKRNLACEASRGELIAHWDDDDWMAPERLRVQVDALTAAGASVTGLRDVLFYRLREGEAWLYRGSSRWPVGGTLLYRRSVWQAHRFDDVSVGEDAAFVARATERVHVSDNTEIYVGLLHPGNTAAKNLSDPAWERRPLDEVTRRLWTDRAFYAQLRNGRTAPAEPAVHSRSTIVVAADFDVTTGYGSMAEYLAVGMARAGADVAAAPLSKRLPGLSSEFQALPVGAPETDAPTIYCSWPRERLDRFRAADLFINTMWESSALPTDWPAALNRARAVVAPTRFVAQVFRDSGVHIPIVVIPEGVDPAVYSYVDRSVDRPLTTLIVGALEPRKHIPEGIAAWQRAFAADPEARLIVKTNVAIEHDDSRIRVVTEQESTRGIAHWYAQADVLLALGNEGFGLPLIEAMATGLPVIALNAEGQSDTCAEAGDSIIAIAPIAWEPHDSSMFGTCGVRALPDVAVVADQLRWVATHRADAKAMGVAASAWALRNRNVWRKGPAVLDAMEQHLRRPLRRGVHMWVSSWRTQCGIAEYTAHLAEGLHTGVHISAQAPELARTRIVHVQHQYGLYDEAALARTCANAHAAGVPVVVTEHMVRPDAPRFERDADVLVSMSEVGAETLRHRWPSTRVEHIPHGCPTWFPRRKQRRGRVIGSFGFMAPHKGFSRLAELTRSDLQLVLFSARGSSEAEETWAAATAYNRNVRRETRFLPVEEIALRLAAEADVLVFWYDDIDAATVSGAVRVGLASGVPVVTSPTTWFADLRDVTYQPADLEEGVRHVLDDTRLRQRLVESATEYCHAHSWARIAERHLALWRSVEN